MSDEVRTKTFFCARVRKKFFLPFSLHVLIESLSLQLNKNKKWLSGHLKTITRRVSESEKRFYNKQNV